MYNGLATSQVDAVDQAKSRGFCTEHTFGKEPYELTAAISLQGMILKLQPLSVVTKLVIHNPIDAQCQWDAACSAEVALRQSTQSCTPTLPTVETSVDRFSCH